MSLSARLLLLVLLAVIPAVCIEIYGQIELRSSRRQEIRDDALRLMRLAASEQARIGEGARQLLIAFSEAAPVRAGDWQGCNQIAARIRAQTEGYTNIGVADLDGHLLCSALPVPPGYKARISEVFLRASASDEVVIGTYLVGHLVKAKILPYAVPQRDERGVVIGIVWAMVDLDWLARHFADRFSTPNMTLLMADRDGTIVLRLPDPETWVGKPIGEPYTPWLHADREGVEDSVGIDGQERVIAYSPLAVTPKGLYVGVGLAKAPIFGKIDAQTRQKLLLISLGFALALLAAWFGGELFIRKPLGALLVATRRWQGGDYSARTQLHDRDSEIGRLGAAFDDMAEALQRRERERKAAEDALAAVNADLEQRVKRAVEEREKAQTALLQSQKIEALGQLTSGVAHDFNNLLAAVLGNLDLLRLRVAEPRAVQLVDGAIRAATRGAKLTEQLLAFSRHHHLEPTPINVNQLLEGMSELLARTIGPTIQISKALADDLWPALADPSQVEVALLNLAINARDAMPLGGSLLLETANLPAGHPRLPPDLNGDFVVLAVSDSGMGMTPDVKARAFEPFFTTKEIGKGTGLGLSMVYGVAKQSGGTVTIDSEPGKGTTVAIFLSRAAAGTGRSTHAGDAALEPRTAGERVSGQVLVVDDDRDVRDVTVAALTGLGLVVSEAENGPAALDLLDRVASVDLLVVDYAMPGLNGAQVARCARGRWPKLPIILVTGFAEAGFADELPDDVQLLHKPFRVADLVALVSNTLAATPRANVFPMRSPKA